MKISTDSNISDYNFNVDDYRLQKDAEDTNLYASAGDYKNTLQYKLDKAQWAIDHMGIEATLKVYELSNEAGNEAVQLSNELNLGSTTGNLADAYRHFAWNAKMTRSPDIGYYGAKNITNRYEYEEMQDRNWLLQSSGEFDPYQDNTIISGRMNQPMLMDLWNNQVGRELANNSNYKNMNIRQLFNMAYEKGWLITDENKVYEFLGISEYKSNDADYAVNVSWNLSTGVIKVGDGRKSVSLWIGI